MRVRSRPLPCPRSRRPTHGDPDGYGAGALNGFGRRAIFSPGRRLPPGLGARHHGRSLRSREGRRQARFHLGRLDYRLPRPARGDARRLRGSHRRRRSLGHRLLAGGGRPDRRDFHARQEQQGIQVAVRLGAPPHAEIDVGLRQFGDSTRPDGSDEGSLGHGVAAPHRDRAEMHERDRVAVRRLDRDRPAAHRHGAREGDDPGRRGEHGCARRSADVDSAVLARRVRIVAEQKRSQHGALHRPRPAQSGSGHGQRSSDCSADEQSNRHRAPPSLSDMETTPKVAGPDDRCQI